MIEPKPAKCHCGSSSWGREPETSRYTCVSCYRPLWAPIETAPTDGSPILICACETGMIVFGQRIAVAKFHTEHDLEHGKVLDFVTDDEGVRINGRRHVRFATHWMPLPDLPKLN